MLKPIKQIAKGSGMLLKCMCCGFEQVFIDGEAAFEAGWDCPPHFTGYVCCNLCPGSFVVLGETHLHKPDHERWAIKGRPAGFSIPLVDQMAAHAREVEGVCSSCGGRTINGTCNARCDR